MSPLASRVIWLSYDLNPYDELGNAMEARVADPVPKSDRMRTPPLSVVVTNARPAAGHRALEPGGMAAAVISGSFLWPVMKALSPIASDGLGDAPHPFRMRINELRIVALGRQPRIAE